MYRYNTKVYISEPHCGCTIQLIPLNYPVLKALSKTFSFLKYILFVLYPILDCKRSR